MNIFVLYMCLYGSIWDYIYFKKNSYMVIYVGIWDFIFAKGVHIWAYMEVYVIPYIQTVFIYGHIRRYMWFHIMLFHIRIRGSYMGKYGSIWNSIFAKRLIYEHMRKYMWFHIPKDIRPKVGRKKYLYGSFLMWWTYSVVFYIRKII